MLYKYRLFVKIEIITCDLLMRANRIIFSMCKNAFLAKVICRLVSETTMAGTIMPFSLPQQDLGKYFAGPNRGFKNH